LNGNGTGLVVSDGTTLHIGQKWGNKASLMPSLMPFESFRRCSI
jgi:hypothetical protein